MTCPTCNLHKEGFSSEAVYLNFEQRLSIAVDRGDLIVLDEQQSGSPFLKFSYVCSKCRGCWRLVVPDHAFRGEWKEILCG